MKELRELREFLECKIKALNVNIDSMVGMYDPERTYQEGLRDAFEEVLYEINN